MTQITEQIKQMRSQQKSDQEIRQELKNQGMTDAQVSEALKDAEHKGKVSLIWGIVAILTSAALGILFGIISIVYGIKAVRQNEGKGMGIAGLILGILSIIINIVVVGLFIMMFFAVSSFVNTVSSMNATTLETLQGVEPIDSDSLSYDEQMLVDTTPENMALSVNARKMRPHGQYDTITFLVRNTKDEKGCFYPQFACTDALPEADACEDQHTVSQTENDWFVLSPPMSLQPGEAKVATVSMIIGDNGTYSEKLYIWYHEGACDYGLASSDLKPDTVQSGNGTYTTRSGTPVSFYKAKKFSIEVN